MILAIVLAAGKSARMGAPKLALPYGDSTILQTVVAKLIKGGCDQVRVVLGFNAQVLLPLLANATAEVVINETPEAGMLSSVKAGLAYVPETADPILIHPGDIPGFASETVWTLLTYARTSDAEVFVPVFGGSSGHPLVFRRSLVPRVLGIPADGRLSDLRRMPGIETDFIEVDDMGILRDIDRPGDIPRG